MGVTSIDSVVPPAYGAVLLDETESTNSEAARRIGRLDDALNGLWVLARRQTKGRGRHGRDWISDAGNLFASLAIPGPLEARRGPELGFIAALAVYDAVHAAAPGTPLALKWPNDVLAGGRKVAGILLESRVEKDHIAHAVIGIGLNITTAPEGTATPAACLADFGADASDPLVHFAALARAMDHWLALWRKRGFSPIRQAWMEKGPELDAGIGVRQGKRTIKGRYAGLDTDGALLLMTQAGEVRISAGDVYETAERT